MSQARHRQWPTRWRLLPLSLAVLLASCGEDPLGPENRFALIAFGQCSYNQALMLTDQAIARGSEDNVQRGLMLKAAILRDRGDTAAAEALYPRISAAWQAAKNKPLSPSRRERDITMFIDIAHAERLANDLDPSCTPSSMPGEPTSREASPQIDAS